MTVLSTTFSVKYIPIKPFIIYMHGIQNHSTSTKTISILALRLFCQQSKVWTARIQQPHLRWKIPSYLRTYMKMVTHNIIHTIMINTPRSLILTASISHQLHNYWCILNALYRLITISSHNQKNEKGALLRNIICLETPYDRRNPHISLILLSCRRVKNNIPITAHSLRRIWG